MAAGAARVDRLLEPIPKKLTATRGWPTIPQETLQLDHSLYQGAERAATRVLEGTLAANPARAASRMAWMGALASP